MQNNLPDISAEFNPLHGIIVILPLKSETERVVNGIVLAGYGNALAKGVVVAAGPGRTLESGPEMPIAVKRGHTVYYNKDAALDHRIGDQTYHLVSYESISGFAP